MTQSFSNFVVISCTLAAVVAMKIISFLLFENYVLKWKGVTSVFRDFYGADEIQKQKKHMSLFCKVVTTSILGRCTFTLHL